jgi:hypothetical protein
MGFNWLFKGLNVYEKEELSAVECIRTQTEEQGPM